MKSTLRKLVLVGVSMAAILVVVMIYSRIVGPDESLAPSSDKGSSNGPVDLSNIKRIGKQGRNLDRGEKLEYYRMGPGGHVEQEYHAQRFTLGTEDRAELEDVKIIWYLKDGQILTLTSQTGYIDIERGAVGRVQPTSGLLSGNVQIVLDSRPQADKTRRPLGQRESAKLIITTDELEFDTRSSRMWTDRAVQLRGAQLDGEGTGLIVRWHQISRQLDSLTILHGGQLTWRPGQGSGFASLMPPEGPRERSSPVQAPNDQAGRENLRSYQASFEDRVRATYRDQVLHNVDRLNILFSLGPDKRKEKTPQGPMADEGGPSTVEPDQQDDEAVPTPLYLTWTGKLTIAPDERQDLDAPAGSKRFEVEALGAPVKFHSRDMSGSCAVLKAKHRSGVVSLFSDSDFPVRFNATDGTSVISDQVWIYPRTSTAEMIGKGSLKSRGRGETPNQPAKPITLSWDAGATLKFLKYIPAPAEPKEEDPAGPKTDYYLAEATAQKNVLAASEQFNVEANQMQIKLGLPGSDGTASGQEVLLLKAWDNFSSKLPGTDLALSADDMVAEFSPRSSGKGQFASKITLDGHVLAIQKTPAKQTQSTLECEEMVINLTEIDDVTASTADSYGGSQISHLLAERRVIGRYLVNGELRSSLWAYKLERDEASKTTVLSGGPAKLVRGEDWLNSAIIRIVERGDDYVLSTPGPGQMQASLVPSEQGSTPGLLGLKWPGSMEFDGQTNKAIFKDTDEQRVTGGIVHGPGVVSKLEARQLDLYLHKSTERTGSGAEDFTKSGKDLASTETFFKPMSDRSLEKMILTGNANVRSIETALDDPEHILRAVLLQSDVLTYDTGKKKRFHGEGTGSLLLQDYRPTEKKVSAEPDESAPGDKATRPKRTVRMERVGRGETAFWWTKSADYDLDERKAVLVGQVHMVSMGYTLTLPGRSAGTDPAQKRQRTQMWCDEFTLTLAQPRETQADGTADSFANLSGMDELEIQSVRANGNARLSSRDLTIDGDKISHDTKANEIRIEGSRKRKAVLTHIDPQKQQWVRYRGKRVIYNTLERKAQAPGGNIEWFAR